MQYDLELFNALNKEYESKPIVPAPRQYDTESLVKNGEVRAQRLVKMFPLENKRILDIGCGRGELANRLQELTGSEVLGFDIESHNEWDLWNNPKLSLRNFDLTRNSYDHLGSFDFIYSMAAMEHVQHPFAMLKAIHSLLKDGATAYLYFNLYRGPLASHCYQDVFFPWPHLLFDDSVFEQFYASIGRPGLKPMWVNCLSIADYVHYFKQLGFTIKKQWYSEKPMDEEFYNRFEDKLGRFPRFDLTKDFIHVILEK